MIDVIGLLSIGKYQKLGLGTSKALSNWMLSDIVAPDSPFLKTLMYKRFSDKELAKLAAQAKPGEKPANDVQLSDLLGDGAGGEDQSGDGGEDQSGNALNTVASKLAVKNKEVASEREPSDEHGNQTESGS